jgi:biotin-dependent carboxylase-like uncharacterized protein
VTGALRIRRAGPSCTIQDAGRFGMLQHGVGASGPMDGCAFGRAGAELGRAGTAGIEFTRVGIDFVNESVGSIRCAVDGGEFVVKVDGRPVRTGTAIEVPSGALVEITPGAFGNYGYVRFDGEIDVPNVLGSRATSLVAGLGGLEGRALRAGDRVPLVPLTESGPGKKGTQKPQSVAGPLRFVWGIHAELFSRATRQAFLAHDFVVSERLDRMGVRLIDPDRVFAGAPILSLVSDAIVPGDVQIIGDGTPIVLMRDHQPTGGYPRIATLISADLDRFAQMRPGTALAFEPVTLQKARLLYLASLAS